MGAATYCRIELAAKQLATAIRAYVNGSDCICAITLAGAAGALVKELVRRAGNQPFIDYARGVAATGSHLMPKRVAYNHYIDNLFGIIALKHHRVGEPLEVEIDERKRAEQAILRAAADYTELRGQDDPVVKPFYWYLWVTRDRTRLMDAFRANRAGRAAVHAPLTPAVNEKYSKADLAVRQLRGAIALYVGNIDRVSAITLAGAADGVLSQLVVEAGKETFADYVSQQEAVVTGRVASRAEVGRALNDVLMINALKHFDRDDEETLTLDVDACGLGAILKGCNNFIRLRGRRADPIVEAFLRWLCDNSPVALPPDAAESLAG